MQDGLEVDLLNFLLGQPESRGKAHANTINLLVPFGLKERQCVQIRLASQTVRAFHAVVFSETYRSLWKVSIWFPETQPGKTVYQGDISLLCVGALNSFGSGNRESCQFANVNQDF